MLFEGDCYIVILEDSMNTGYLVSLLFFSEELDSFHSTYSAWYRRDMLIETLHNIFLEYTNRLYKKCYYFLSSFTGFFLILILF